MKKHNTRTKMNDQIMVSRVKTYLAENIDKTYVDVSQMARSLKERYREYNNRSESAFCQMVEDAYKIVLESYGIDGPSTSDGSEEESDLELLDESGGALNDRLLAMYKLQDKKRPAAMRRPTDKSGEPIDIISSDEDGSAAQKLPKINDQITITPHIPSLVSNNKNDARSTSKSNQKLSSENKKRKLDSSKNNLSKKRFEMPSTKPKVTFDDIGGISEILTQICDLVLHMRHPEIYKQLGIKSPRGALLHGPPGTGKTLLAHAIAGKLEVPLVSVCGTELVGGVSGESEERIRELFDNVVSIAPSVLFIDEIDAVCRNRLHAHKDMEKRMVAQLLACLDSLGDNESMVLVLAATNNPDALDPALRRAGRLEQEITLGIPSLKARKEILTILCKNMALAENVDMQELAQVTPGFVGADLQALVNKACTFAVKRVFNEIKIKEKNEANKEIVENNKTTELEATVPNGESTLVDDKEDKDKNESTEKDEITPTETLVEKLPEEPTDSVNCTSNNETVNTNIEIDVQAEVLSLLENTKPYTKEQLSGLAIRQDDFLKALKTTKPCAVREGIITVPDVTWDDVGSLNQVRKDLQLAVLAPVKYPELLKKLGLGVPSGVLLCGPPGCGKTLLAKAVANEAGVNFISVKGPELLNMYVGESERAVRTCFRRARNSAPCVIFFDEFDALCPRRSQQDHNGAARVVNQLLTEMDGIESREGVFVLAASNRPDIIDPAVLRPGRLDRVMYVGMPAKEDRIDIIRKLTKNGTQPPLAPDVDLEMISEITEGYTGADLAGLVRAAASNALTHHIASDTVDGEILVTHEHFREALGKIRPSVSCKEQLHYEKLRLKYAVGIDDKDMAMETEALNEESMDTI